MEKLIDICIYVNEQKRTVVAVQENFCAVMMADVVRTFKKMGLREPYWAFEIVNKYCPDKVVAKAKCHPNDTFNAEDGYLLAEARLNKRMTICRAKVWSAIEAKFHECYERASDRADAEIRHLDYLEETLKSE